MSLPAVRIVVFIREEESVSRNVARAISMSVLAAGLLAAPLVAQKPGAFEFGVFGRYTVFDDVLNLDNKIGAGARLGIFFLPNLQLEAAGSWTKIDPITHYPVYGRLVYNLRMADKVALLIGAGGVYNEYIKAENDIGASGLLGLRFGFGDLLAVRLEGVADYMPSPKNAGDKNLNLAAQFGLSLVFGGAAVKDSDGDGVSDNKDRCPATVAGERVDAVGCPVDSDRDGVTDLRDRCPDSAAGTPVDETGCPRDSDGDGVRDPRDRCPDTPAGTPVDASGCPRDADRDGVPDAADKCANTPQGVAVDAAGCPKDSDGDGVPDTADKCADTPKGATVDAGGCPKDADGDGVLDGIDRCAGTAMGAKVDAVGCPVLFAAEARSVVLQGVTFASGRAELTAGAKTVLDQVAASLVGNPDVKVEVGGHTDNTGQRATNVRLSQARADAVRSYLIEKGVGADRLAAKGYGPDQPVADNATAAGRARNRRVELKRTN